MKKIVYITPSLYCAGGIERVLTAKMNYLAEVMGEEVTVILTDGAGKEPYFPLSPKVKVINLNIGFEEMWNRPLLEKIRISHKKEACYRKQLEETLMTLRADYVITTLRREINFLSKINDGSIKIGEMHINRKHFRNFEGRYFPFKRLITYLWMRQLITQLKLLNRVVVLTEDDRRQWPELNNLECIPNVVETREYDDELRGMKRVIAVGRYCYQKGFDLLIEAWREVARQRPDWTLEIYGAGDSTPYQQLVDKAELTASVHLCGPSSDIFNHYASSDIMVLSSRFEGFGLVIVEAMGTGLPVVAFDCECGPREIITDMEDGILVRPEDTEKLAEQLLLLINDGELRRKMGEKARIKAKAYAPENIMRQWYDKVFTQPSPVR